MADDDPDIIAAELALGLLEGEERAAALRRMLADLDFTRAVEAWQVRLAPLGDMVSGAPPSVELWRRIERAIGGDAEGEQILYLKLRRWQAFAATVTVIAASLALVLVIRPSQVPPPVSQPALIAQLGPSDARAVLLASYDQGRAELTITPATIATEGHSVELWVIPDGDKPHSLGLVGASGTTRIVIPIALRGPLLRGATIAVSLEPQGGSPTGQPTGPVVAVGKFTKI